MGRGFSPLPYFLMLYIATDKRVRSLLSSLFSMESYDTLLNLLEYDYVDWLVKHCDDYSALIRMPASCVEIMEKHWPPVTVEIKSTTSLVDNLVIRLVLVKSFKE
jgi:hypothetical protein